MGRDDRVSVTLLYEVHVNIQMDSELANEGIANRPVFTKRSYGMATSSVRFATSATGCKSPVGPSMILDMGSSKTQKREFALTLPIIASSM
jgi:hypothetical protein